VLVLENAVLLKEEQPRALADADRGKHLAQFSLD
jgi:hypothetical protein